MAIKPIEILINAKDNASGVFSSLQAKVAAVGAAVLAYFGVDAFVGIVKGAADFEQAMSRVQAATGASGEEMAQLKKAAEDAGATTKYTAAQAAGALENLAKAGLDSTQAITALPAVLNLATAADVELGTAAEYVTKAVMGMGLSFDDAGRVADVLAKGANASNTSVNGLAQALSYVAPIAKASGVSLEGTVAIIGKLADGGIDASRAGTGLANIMAQFSDPSSKFKEALLGAGITTKNFEQAIHELAAAGPRAEKAILAVGLEAGPALRSLLNQGMGALDDLKGKLNDSAGSAAAAAAIMSNNLNGSLTGLGSAWDTVKNTLATPILPVLKDGVDQLAAALRGAVSDGTIANFGASLKTAFEGSIKWAKDFAASIDFSAVAAKLQTSAQDFGAAMTAIASTASFAGNVVRTVWGVMSAGTNTVMVGVYGIAAAFSGVASNILNGAAAISEGLAKITFGGLSERFKNAAAEAREAAGGMWAVSEEFGRKAGESFDAAADAAQTARNGFAGLGEVIAGTANQASGATPAVQGLANAAGAAATETEKLAKAAEAAAAASAARQAADAAAAQKTEELRQNVSQLETEYHALVAAQDFQGAVEKHQQLSDALKKLEASTRASGEAAIKAAQDFDAGLVAMGVNADAAMGRVGGAVSTAIQSLTELQKAAQDAGLGAQGAGRAMEMAFAAATPKANSLEGIEALKAKLSELQSAGVLSAEGVARLTEQLRAQSQEVQAQIPGIQSLGEALLSLGVKPQAELDRLAKTASEAFQAVSSSGSATAREVDEAWRAMAERVIAANGGIATAALQAEASAHGFAVAVDSAGKATVQAMGAAAAATQKMGGAMDGVAASAKAAGDAAQDAGEKIAQAGDKSAEAAKSAAKPATSLLAPAWTDAAAAASKYAYEATKAMWESVNYAGVSTQNFLMMSSKATEYVHTLERLDAQERALQETQKGTARNIENLRMRLLEINGTEEEIAAAKAERERKAVLLEMEVQKIQLEKARLQKNKEGVSRAEAELDALRQQLDLLGQIETAETRKRATQKQESSAASKGNSRGAGTPSVPEVPSIPGVPTPTAPGVPSTPTVREIPGIPSTPSAPSRTVNVNLALGGRGMGSVNTDSEGADAIERLMRELETSRRASGF